MSIFDFDFELKYDLSLLASPKSETYLQFSKQIRSKTVEIIETAGKISAKTADIWTASSPKPSKTQSAPITTARLYVLTPAGEY